MKQRGFTLIELLTVIGIIGILATVVLLSLSNSRERARDVTRKGDLRTIKAALELYYSDQDPYAFKIQTTAAEANAANTGLTSDYIKNIPTDPKGTRPYMYLTDASGANFALFADLENSGDSERKTTNPTAGAMPANYDFWVEND